MVFFRSAALAALLCALPGAGAAQPHRAGGLRPPPAVPSFDVKVAATRIFAGSAVEFHVEPAHAGTVITLIGPGRIEAGRYLAPADVSAPVHSAIVAAAPGHSAVTDIIVVPYPPRAEALVAVACYDAGIALHRRSDMRLEGVIPLAAGAAALGYSAKRDLLYALSARSGALHSVSLRTWEMATTAGIDFGNELAVDDRRDAVLVTDRDVQGQGALTEMRGSGTRRVVTGKTAEGIALDRARGLVYVGNVNDGTIAEFDRERLLRRRVIAAGSRPFGMALDPLKRRLYVVSNEPAQSQTRGPSVLAIDLAPAVPRIAARSAHFTFPLGVVFDARGQRIFVTDEGAGAVYVLDARTLRSVHAPLRTCKVPWQPALDVALQRLYIPCAHADAVAVFELRGLRELPGSPFATGGYPLALVTARGPA